MSENIFDSLIENDSLFVNRGAFEHGFEPQKLPHREKEVRALGENLVEALRGHIPSNMLLRIFSLHAPKERTRAPTFLFLGVALPLARSKVTI